MRLKPQLHAQICAKAAILRACGKKLMRKRGRAHAALPTEKLGQIGGGDAARGQLGLDPSKASG